MWHNIHCVDGLYHCPAPEPKSPLTKEDLEYRPECQWPTHKFFLDPTTDKGNLLKAHRPTYSLHTQMRRRLSKHDQPQGPWDASLWCRVQIRLTDLKPLSNTTWSTEKGRRSSCGSHGFSQNLGILVCIAHEYKTSCRAPLESHR